MASINPFFEYVATYRRKHRALKQQRVIVSRAAAAWKGLSASHKSRCRKKARDERYRRLKIADKKSDADDAPGGPERVEIFKIHSFAFVIPN